MSHPAPLRKYLQCYFFLLGDKRRQAAWVCAMILLMSLLDTLCVSGLGAFVSAALDQSALQRGRLGSLAVWSGLGRNFFPVFGVAVLLAFVVRGVLAYITHHKTITLAYVQQRDLIQILTQAYLRLPYEKLVAKESAALVQGVHDHVQQYASYTLTSSLRLVAEGCVCLAMLGLLFYTDVVMTLLLCAAAFAAFLAYDRKARSIIRDSARAMADSGRSIIGLIGEIFSGIKEIRVYGAERFFLKRVGDNSQRLTEAAAQNNLVRVAPRHIIEICAIGFVVVYFSLAVMNGATDVALGKLSVLALALLRGMPALNVMVDEFGRMRHSALAMFSLADDLREVGAYAKSDVVAPVQLSQEFQRLELCQVSYTYPGRSEPALRNLDLRLERGQCIGVVGRSGSGKTTLIDTIIGFLPPAAGTLQVNGQPVDPAAWARRVAYIPQNVFILNDTLARNVAFGVADADIDLARVDAAVHTACLDSMLEQLPGGLNGILGERGINLSGGQRQRIALARAFYHARDVLVLDEATSALDQETEREIVKSIDELRGKVTIIVIAHRLSTVAKCDVILRLDAGAIVQQGSFAEIFGHSADRADH